MTTRFQINFSFMNSGQCHNHIKEVAPECGYILPTLGWSDSLEVLLQCATIRILEKYVIRFILYVAPVEADKVRQRLLVCARVKPPERSRFALVVLFSIRVYSCVRFKDENILRGRTYLSKMSAEFALDSDSLLVSPHCWTVLCAGHCTTDRSRSCGPSH